MPFVQAKCPNCGGTLAVDNSNEAAVCPFCNTPYIVEKAINNYHTYNNINIESGNTVIIYGNDSQCKEQTFNEETIKFSTFSTKQVVFKKAILFASIISVIIAAILFILFLLNDGRALMITQSTWGNLCLKYRNSLMLFEISVFLLTISIIFLTIFLMIKSKKCMFSKHSSDELQKLFLNTRRKILLVNDKDIYKSFVHIITAGKYSCFNVKSFLFPYIWFIKRKMIHFSALIILLYCLVGILITFSYDMMGVVLGVLSFIIVHIVSGFLADYAYMQYLEQTYQKSKTMQDAVAETFLTKQSQNTAWLIILAVLLFIVLGVSIVALLRWPLWGVYVNSALFRIHKGVY